MEILLENRIKNYFFQWKQTNPYHWLPKGHIEELAMNAGFLPSSADRRLRSMVQQGILEKRKTGKSLEYRYL